MALDVALLCLFAIVILGLAGLLVPGLGVLVWVAIAGFVITMAIAIHKRQI